MLRKELHRAISNGNLERVKALFLNESKDEKDSIYLNSKKHSALWTAIAAGKFEIYAFLKSKGFNFKDKKEQQCIVHLNDSQKNSLSKALVPYFIAVDNAHILHLVSKTKSFQEQVKVRNFQEQIEKLYKELDKIPEISIILKVMQYCDYLTIIVDFNQRSIIDIDPAGKKALKGQCYREDGQLYIDIKLDQDERDQLGTLAHEFTHYVMQIIYKNDCHPYCQSDVEQQSKFKTIVDTIKECSTVDNIVTCIFELYEENMWPAELIVRVPHMLAKYGAEEGKQKLQAQALELLEYYKKNVMDSCKRFIENSYLIKPRNDILLLNQYSGIIDKSVELDIHFKEPVDLKDFFESENKQMLLLNVTNTWLCTVNVYQSVKKIPPNSLLHNYLFLKFDHYIKQKEKINKLLYNSEVSNLLIIQSPDNSDEEQLKEVLVSSFYILNKKPKKKIIFIINENEINGFMTTLNSIANLDPTAYLQNEHYEKINLNKDFILNDLTQESHKKLLEKKVTFQTHLISLKQLINNVENLKEIINDARTLENLSSEVTIDDKLPISSGYDASYYIERTLIYQPTIKTEIFKTKTSFGKEITDIFAISNINQENLQKLVPEKSKVKLFEGGANDELTRFYVLNKKQAPVLFTQLCQKNSAFNIHWLRYESESNSFIWQQSQGSLSILRQYTDSHYTKSYLETEWMQHSDYIKKIIIISDTAGMGKSTILTSFSQLIKKENPDIWLIRIDLNEHTDKLNKQKEKAGFKTQEIDIAIAFLANTMLQLKTPLEQALFKHYCQHSKLIVMFDGFDEISPDYKETVIDLIQTLRKSQIKQIWITTRPNMREDLEDALQHFAHTLKPFSEDDQKEFLTKFWEQKSNLPKGNQKLKEYAGTLIELLAKSVSDKEKEFTGIPLQTRMLAEIFQDECQNINDSKFLTPTLPATLGLMDLYELFLKKKFDIYIKEKNKLDISKPGVLNDASYAKFIEQHQSLALYTLFGTEEREILLNEKFCQELSAQYPGLAQAVSQQENLKELLVKDNRNTIFALMRNINEGKERTGIIDQIKEDKPHFIHRTFAEYLVANFLVNSLQQQIIIELQESIIKNVLIESDYQVIRAFVNGFLKEKVTLPESTLKLHGKKIADLWKLDMSQLKSKNLCNQNDDTILHIAALEDNVNIVSFLLDSVIKHEEVLKSLTELTNKDKMCTTIQLTVEKSKDLEAFMDAKNKDNKTALHLSSERGYLDVAICLIEKGADIEAKTINGWTPLHLAAIYCNLEIVKYLVEKGANVNVKTTHVLTPFSYVITQTEHGNTPLHFAVNEGNLEIVKYLVEKGANVDVKNGADCTPLHNAAIKGDLEIVKYFKENGAAVNAKTEQDDTLLYFAAIGGNVEVVKYLVENGADVKKVSKRYAPLHSAAMRGNLDVVKYLVEKGCDVNIVNENGQTLFVSAVIGGNLDLVKYLVEEGVVPNVTNKYGTTLLHSSALGNKLEIVKYLVEKGADIKNALKNNWPLLLSVAIGGDLDIVKHLVEKGTDVNAANEDGRTPLHIAVATPNLDLVKYLVEKGANVYVTDYNGETPLQLAAKADNLDVVKYLVEKGSDANVANKYGETLLHLAVIQDNLDVVRYLVEKAVNVNVADKSGKTPLCCAVKEDNLELVKFLVEKGADVNVADNFGETPLCCAVIKDNLELVKFLVEKGADVNVENMGGTTPLHSAIIRDNLYVVIFLIEKGADVNVANKDGRTPLHSTIVGHNLDVVKYLVEKGAAVCVADKDGETPLHSAISKGNLDVVKYLVEKGAAVCVADNYGKTPLHSAISKGNLDVVKYLVEKQADVNVLDKDGGIPLCCDVVKDNLELVKYLVEKGADVDVADNYGKTPLQLATEGNNLEIVKYLVGKGADVKNALKNDWSLLYSVTKCSNFDVVKFLVEKGADVNVANKNGMTPLHSAIRRDNLGLVKYLVEKGADVYAADNYGETPLQLATEGNNMETVKYLVEKGADVKNALKSRCSQIHSVATCGNLGVVKFLVEKGADVNVANTDGRTPLHSAIYKNNLGLVKYLVEKGADVYVADNYGETPLQLAAKAFNLDVVKYLVEKAAYVNVADKDGKTPLHSAIKGFNLDVVKYLVEKGADINVPDNDGWTPLCCATKEGDLELVKYLVEKGGNINMITGDGCTLLNYAIRKGNMEVVKYLVKKGANVNMKTSCSETPLQYAARECNLDLVKFLVENKAHVNISAIYGNTPLHSAATGGNLEVVKYLVEKEAIINMIDFDGLTPLDLAVKEGNTEVVKYLAEKEANVNVAKYNEEMPLHYAARECNLDIAE